jgi:hypothetical protein
VLKMPVTFGGLDVLLCVILRGANVIVLYPILRVVVPEEEISNGGP